MENTEKLSIAPFRNHANLFKSAEPGVPGVTPSRFGNLGEFA
jgi:hypothetical protein